VLPSAAAAAASGLLLALAAAGADVPPVRGVARSAALGAGSWSVPETLASGCMVAGEPQVAFPSAGPQLPTGPGAIVWSSEPSRCVASSAARSRRSSRLTLAAVGPSERPAITATRPLSGVLKGQLAAVGGSFGRITIAAVAHNPSAPADVTVLQGRATRRLGSPAFAFAEAGSLVALAHGYLGEVAIATLRGTTIAVRVERHYLHGFGPTRLVRLPRGHVTSLVVTMDFRSDVLLAWQQDAAVYAEVLRASGRSDPVQRVGPSGPHPQLQALVSDNDHGVLAWSSPGIANRTSTYVDLSAAGVRFGAPRLLASFSDPAEVGRSPGSLALVRLSSENAILLWTDLQHGHYVVRGSPTGFAASRPAAALSDPRAQAVLAALAPGPEREAIALWTSPAGGHSDPRAARTQLWAARLFVVPHDRIAERNPEMVAAPGVLAAVSVAVDPRDDRALAAWLGPRAGGRIEYAVSRAATSAPAAAPRVGRPSAGGRSAGGTPWLPITLAAAGAAGALLMMRGALVRRHRHPGEHSGPR
jgi:hypothetical protein